MVPVTNTIMPPETDGWKSFDPRLTLQTPKGIAVSLFTMFCVPWNFCPSNVSIEASWYSVPSAARLLSNSW